MFSDIKKLCVKVTGIEPQGDTVPSSWNKSFSYLFERHLTQWQIYLKFYGLLIRGVFHDTYSFCKSSILQSIFRVAQNPHSV